MLAITLGLPAHAGVEIPPPVQQSLPQLQLVGSGKMTWFGLHIYDAALWAPARTVDFSSAFALAIRYSRNFKGDRIAQRSAVEIERLSIADAGQIADWEARMARIFPDVRAGETLTGLYYPGRGAEFYHQDRPVGRIADPAFARAFFSIWLDPRTREPELRQRLIGQR
jgi:hypothetical protein